MGGLENNNFDVAIGFQPLSQGIQVGQHRQPLNIDGRIVKRDPSDGIFDSDVERSEVIFHRAFPMRLGGLVSVKALGRIIN